VDVLLRQGRRPSQCQPVLTGDDSARANGVEPFEYLSEVFEQLPAATTVEAIQALLPWNLKSVLDARRRPQKASPQIAAT
jgi:hypothetical protein